MKHYLTSSFSVWMIVLGVVFFAAIAMFFLRHDDSRLSEADKSYSEGESTQTIYLRQKAFNHALDLYLALETEYQPRYGNGKLYYNIGNTFFQLGQYPWAVLYYERASYLQPRNEKVQRNLMRAQDKLQLSRPGTESVFAKVFFFHTYLSVPERLQIFAIVTLTAFFLSSAWIWYRNRWFKNGLILALVILFVMLMSLGYSRYLSPVEGVLVQSVNLRRDAGEQYAKAGKQPVPAGTTVEVLNVIPDGSWLKVITPAGDLGYVSQDAIRMVGT